jgi:hypothetical protein
MEGEREREREQGGSKKGVGEKADRERCELERGRGEMMSEGRVAVGQKGGGKWEGERRRGV